MDFIESVSIAVSNLQTEIAAVREDVATNRADIDELQVGQVNLQAGQANLQVSQANDHTQLVTLQNQMNQLMADHAPAVVEDARGVVAAAADAHAPAVAALNEGNVDQGQEDEVRDRNDGVGLIPGVIIDQEQNDDDQFVDFQGDAADDEPEGNPAPEQQQPQPENREAPLPLLLERAAANLTPGSNSPALAHLQQEHQEPPKLPTLAAANQDEDAFFDPLNEDEEEGEEDNVYSLTL